MFVVWTLSLIFAIFFQLVISDIFLHHNFTVSYDYFLNCTCRFFILHNVKNACGQLNFLFPIQPVLTKHKRQETLDTFYLFFLNIATFFLKPVKSGEFVYNKN